MDGPNNKVVRLSEIRERKIPIDFTYIWYIKKKKKDKLMGAVEVNGVKRYKLPLKKQISHEL